MKFGVQTFTIRKEQKKDFLQSYLPLIKMNITDLEIARIDFTRENAIKIKEIIDEYGINPVSIQVKPKYVFFDVDGVVEFCNIVGCKNVVISMLPFKCILGSESEFYRFVNSLDPITETYAKKGITLAYHHHNWEYIKLSNGKTRMQELVSHTSKIKFVHDTYWTARCGIDPVKQIEIFSDRLLGIHLRDLTFKKRGIDVLSVDTSIGDGVIDFSRVLKAASDVGCSYYVIEQKTKTPYLDIEKSYKYLNSIISDNKE